MPITLPQMIVTRSNEKQATPMIIERKYDHTYVSMYINPQRISIRQRKVIQQVQTNTGWIFQHWGYEPLVISYNGVTGYMNPWEQTQYEGPDLEEAQAQVEYTMLNPVTAPSPYKTAAYKALSQLRDFYESPQKQLLGSDLTKITAATDAEFKKLALNLYYRADIYEGYLTRFELSEEENSPWMWSYSMEFTAYSSDYSVRDVAEGDSGLMRFYQKVMEEGTAFDPNLTASKQLSTMPTQVK